MISGEDRILELVGKERSDFDSMCALYRGWNEKINVISRKDIDFVFEHHVLHSLCIAALLSERRPDVIEQWKKGVADNGGLRPARILDLGCGGGFPGIPLAFCFPDAEFTLCDSTGKKITVVTALADALGLKNVRAVHGRAEELQGRWDWVVSRAVAPLETILLWTAGKFDRGIICLKGGDLSAETQACLCPKMTRQLARYGLKSPSVEIWSIADVLGDEYYQEKFIISLKYINQGKKTR